MVKPMDVGVMGAEFPRGNSHAPSLTQHSSEALGENPLVTYIRGYTDIDEATQQLEEILQFTDSFIFFA